MEETEEEWLEYYGPQQVRCRTCTHLLRECTCINGTSDRPDKQRPMANNATRQVILKNVRLSFPVLFKAESSFERQEPKFSATFLVSKDDPQANILRQAVTELAKEKWGGSYMPKEDKLCVFAGDKKDYDGYAGMIAVKASSKKRPRVVNRDKSPILESDNVIYAGCYVNAAIAFWAQDNSIGGKRINAFLQGVQFAADGEAFGSSFDADGTFEDLTGGATDETQDKPATGPGSDDDLPF